MATRPEEILAAIAALTDELEKLRNICQHELYEVGWWSWRMGDMRPSKICSYCKAYAGEPTQTEINDFIAKQRETKIKFLRETYYAEEAERLINAMALFDNDPWTKEV